MSVGDHGEVTSDPAGPAAPRRARLWLQDARLPIPTLAFFVVLAVGPWLIAIWNRYLFNVMLALVGSVPLVIVALRGAAKAGSAHRSR